MTYSWPLVSPVFTSHKRQARYNFPQPGVMTQKLYAKNNFAGHGREVPAIAGHSVLHVDYSSQNKHRCFITKKWKRLIDEYDHLRWKGPRSKRPLKSNDVKIIISSTDSEKSCAVFGFGTSNSNTFSDLKFRILFLFKIVTAASGKANWSGSFLVVRPTYSRHVLMSKS